MCFSIYSATWCRRALFKNVIISLIITTLCDPDVWYRPLAFTALVVLKKIVLNSLVGLLSSRKGNRDRGVIERSQASNALCPIDCIICCWNDIVQTSDSTKASNAHLDCVELRDSLTRQYSSPGIRGLLEGFENGGIFLKQNLYCLRFINTSQTSYCADLDMV